MSESDPTAGGTRPQPLATPAFFDAVAGRYERVYALPGDVSRERMERVIAELPPRGRVLDLGVGTGRELGALQDAGHEVVGLDASSAMLARCARRARPIELVEGDFWAPLPFPAGSFDAVVALHGTLAHPEGDDDVTRLAAEVHRVLRPGGVWVSELPSVTWIAAAAAAPNEEMHLDDEGDGAFVHVDDVVGAAVRGRLYDDARWSRLVGLRFRVRVTPFDEGERLVVAARLE